MRLDISNLHATHSSTLFEADFSKYLREDRHLYEATVETKVAHSKEQKIPYISSEKDMDQLVVVATLSSEKTYQTFAHMQGEKRYVQRDKNQTDFSG